MAGFVGNARLAWGLEDSVDAMLYELAARVDDFEATLGSINAVVFEPEPTEASCTGENGGRYGDDGFTWIPMACDLDAASDGRADCPEEGCDYVAAGWTTEATLSEAQLSAVADLRCLVGRSQQAVRANGPQVFGARALAVHLICGVPILVAILGVVAAVISSPKLSCFVTGAWLSWLLIVVWLSFGLHAYLAVIFGDLCMELDLTLHHTPVRTPNPAAQKPGLAGGVLAASGGGCLRTAVVCAGHGGGRPVHALDHDPLRRWGVRRADGGAGGRRR